MAAEGGDPPLEKGFRDVLEGMRKITIEWWTSAPRRVEVDVFLVATPYQRAAFARRVRTRLDGREAWIVSPADLIVHKLIAGRSKDYADVQNVLTIQGLPDRSYLESWAAELGLSDRLRRSLADAGLDRRCACGSLGLQPRSVERGRAPPPRYFAPTAISR